MIHSHLKAWSERYLSGDGHIMSFPVRYGGIGGQVSIMIRKKVKLHGPFGTSELGPGNREKQRDMVVLFRESTVFVNRNLCVPGAAFLHTERVS